MKIPRKNTRKIRSTPIPNERIIDFFNGNGDEPVGTAVIGTSIGGKEDSFNDFHCGLTIKGFDDSCNSKRVRLYYARLRAQLGEVNLNLTITKEYNSNGTVRIAVHYPCIHSNSPTKERAAKVVTALRNYISKPDTLFKRRYHKVQLTYNNQTQGESTHGTNLLAK